MDVAWMFHGCCMRCHYSSIVLKYPLHGNDLSTFASLQTKAFMTNQVLSLTKIASDWESHWRSRPAYLVLKIGRITMNSVIFLNKQRYKTLIQNIKHLSTWLLELIQLR